jgi:MFS family permease
MSSDSLQQLPISAILEATVNSQRERPRPLDQRAWFIVAALFAIGAFIFGGTISTPGVFFAPLIKEFGWSHARVSSLASAVTLGTIPGSIAAGFLLERIDARIPIVSGATLTGGSLLFATQVNSYFALLIFYFFAGMGVGMSTLLPMSLVVANWFREKRGSATGVAIAGVSVGGMIMVQVAATAIRASGWRAGLAALAAPILLIAVPLAVLVIRTRPSGEAVRGLMKEHVGEDLPKPPELEGFSLAEAIRTRSFWLIAAATFLFAFTVYGILTQLVVYLIGVGYRPGAAAIVLGLMLGLNAAGKVVFGVVADRIGARMAMAVSFAIMGCGILLLFGAREVFVLASFLAVYGPTWGAPLALVPLVTIESLGLKHYGSLGGILRIAEATGAVLGPVALGRVFDLTNSYRPAFGLSVFCAVLAILATLGCEKFTPALGIAAEIVDAPEAVRI